MAGVILGLDPSSTIIGYGALTRDLRLVQAGPIKPNHSGDGSFDRVMAMAADLDTLFASLQPRVILVEWTKGKVGKRHKGLGAGLAVYGCGVGAAGLAAWRWSLAHPECVVHAILENDWTRGKAKDERQLGIASLYPEYAQYLREDRGGDIADAIGLADWWIKEKRASESLF